MEKIPYSFFHSGTKFAGFHSIPFGLGDYCISLPNFSFLPHLEVCQLLWTDIKTWVHYFVFVILVSKSCLAPSKTNQKRFLLNSDNLCIFNHIKLSIAFSIHHFGPPAVNFLGFGILPLVSVVSL
jgi:hypothetical protein